MKRKDAMSHMITFCRKRAKLERDDTYRRVLNGMQEIIPNSLPLSQSLRHDYDTYEEAEFTFSEEMKFNRDSRLLNKMSDPFYWLNDRKRIASFLDDIKCVDKVTMCHFYMKIEIDREGALVSYFHDDTFADVLAKFLLKIKDKYLAQTGTEKTLTMSCSFFIGFI